MVVFGVAVPRVLCYGHVVVSAASLWVGRLSSGSFFRSADVPGCSRSAVSSFLARETSKTAPRVMRVAPNLYWKPVVAEEWPRSGRGLFRSRVSELAEVMALCERAAAPAAEPPARRSQSAHSASRQLHLHGRRVAAVARGHHPTAVKRNAAISGLRRVVVAPCSTVNRGLATEARLELYDDPVRSPCVVQLDSVRMS